MKKNYVANAMMKTGENIHFKKTSSYVKALVNEFSKIASVFQ